MTTAATGGEYENYNSTSKNYDSGRQTVGLEEFLGAVALSVGGELKKARILDVGCGTGNYVTALSPYVATVTGVEYNPGMLEQARKKTVDLLNIELLEGDATCLPLPSESYDAVMCTQMIHHLPSTDGFLALSKFLTEARRVLKKDNGVIIINTCTPQQSRKCWIGSGLAPNYIAERYPPINTLCSLLDQAGFTCSTIVSNAYQRLIQPHVLLDTDGPLSKEWRGFHSAWSCLSDRELMDAQNEWRKRQSNGTLDQFSHELEESVKSIGETTTLVATKKNMAP